VSILQRRSSPQRPGPGRLRSCTTAPPWTPIRHGLAFLEAVAGQRGSPSTTPPCLRTCNDQTVIWPALRYHPGGMSRAMDLRDKETEGHTQRVTDLTVRLARARVCARTRWCTCGEALPPTTLAKWAFPMRSCSSRTSYRRGVDAHAASSRACAGPPQPVEYLRPALVVSYAHHEKVGWERIPQGVRGDQSRWRQESSGRRRLDALTSDRPYRPAWSRSTL